LDVWDFGMVWGLLDAVSDNERDCWSLGGNVWLLCGEMERSLEDAKERGRSGCGLL
jgi:hypothetical protein